MPKNKTTITIYKPEHSQEEIQDVMIALWLNNCKNEQDTLRANYVNTYNGSLGGWCDGWSYTLSYGAEDLNGEDLADLWQVIDNHLTTGKALSLTNQYRAYTFARKASRYHIMNNPSPVQGTPGYTAYDEADYTLEHKPVDSETWKHDERTTLELYVIKEDIKSLTVGHTLRLTSPIHDAAVQRIKNGFIVAETESHGIQKCTTLDAVMLILNEWKEECESKNAPFFNQTMVV